MRSVGLLPEERLDKGTRRLLSEEVLQRAIKLLEYERIAQAGEVKRTTLSRAFCRQGMSRAEVTRSKETFRPREAPYPNALWQMDTQHVLVLPTGRGLRRINLVGCIDDYSRHVVARLYLQDNRPSSEPPRRSESTGMAYSATIAPVSPTACSKPLTG
ncbi:MAG: hypothetical protein M0Z66_02875 [Thermaerobacter sp.]|nr:hypothetical protein [Thermaerobacter sp.]